MHGTTIVNDVFMYLNTVYRDLARVVLLTAAMHLTGVPGLGSRAIQSVETQACTGISNLNLGLGEVI